MPAVIKSAIVTETDPLHYDAVAQWLVEQVSPLFSAFKISGDDVGVYLSTPDVGVNASIEFWGAALAETPAFANPRDFAWTLANSAAAYVSLVHDLRGPNHVLVGADDASRAALIEAIADLEEGIVNYALVLRFVIGGFDRSTSLCGLLLTAMPTVRDVISVASISPDDPIEIFGTQFLKKSEVILQLESV